MRLLLGNGRPGKVIVLALAVALVVLWSVPVARATLPYEEGLYGGVTGHTQVFFYVVSNQLVIETFDVEMECTNSRTGDHVKVIQPLSKDQRLELDPFHIGSDGRISGDYEFDDPRSSSKQVIQLHGNLNNRSGRVVAEESITAPDNSCSGMGFADVRWIQHEPLHRDTPTRIF